MSNKSRKTKPFYLIKEFKDSKHNIQERFPRGVTDDNRKIGFESFGDAKQEKQKRIKSLRKSNNPLDLADKLSDCTSEEGS